MKLNNVVAAIIKKGSYYFIAQRNKNKYMGLKWEFPGGKVEIGETFEEALVREIKEELNIQINILNKITEEKFNDHTINVIIHYYLCSMENDLIELLEHNKFAWVNKNEFYKYSFVHGDDKILSLL